MEYYIEKKKVNWLRYAFFSVTHFMTHQQIEIQNFDKPVRKIMMTFAEAEHLKQKLLALIGESKKEDK